MFDHLESRVLMDGLPTMPVQLPFIDFTSGVVNYDSVTGILTATVGPHTNLNYVRRDKPATETDFITDASITINIKLDSSGNLFVGGSHDGAGTNANDLVVTGNVFYDNDDGVIETITPGPTGTLLVAHITSFAVYSPPGGVDDVVQFGFQIDGGPLFDPMDLSGGFPDPGLAGISEAHIARGTFAAGFNHSAHSSVFQGTLASVPTDTGGGSPPPGLMTTPGSSIVIGSGDKLTDSATLSGGVNLTGTLQFQLYNSASSVVYTDVVTVTGSGNYDTSMGTNAGGFLPSAVDTYQWVVTYSGDANNAGAFSGWGSEPETVTKAGPAINTIAGGTVVIGNGGALSDTAILSGGFNPTGTVTFTLYNPLNVAVYTDVVTVSGNGTYTTAAGNNPGGFVPTVAGNYLWTATYSGDSNNAGATDNGQNENQAVSKATPSLNTTPGSAVVIGSGARLTDSAVLSGGFNETGALTFTLYDAGSNPVYTDVVAVNGNGTYTTAAGNNPGGYLPTAVGTYQWVVSYNGDGNNNFAVSGWGSEPETVTKASPLITTQASQTGSAVGSTQLKDSVTVSGGYAVTGTVVFTLTQPDNTTITVGSVTISGANTYYSPTVTATQVGTYTWHANYSGDSLNNGAVDQGGSAEQSTTTKASPSIVTSASFSAGNVVGASMSDSATIIGGYSASGTITFTITAPGATSSTTVGTVAVSGAGTYNSPTVTATQVGTYTWHAIYSGNGLNNGAVDNGVNESLTTKQAQPSLVTTATLSCSTVVGAAIPQDKAVISGAYNPTGSLTFILTAPDGSVADTETRTVSANGTYTTSNTHVATQVGTYTWTVSYSGDTFNFGARDQGDSAEQVTVGYLPITISGKKYNDIQGDDANCNAIDADDVVLGGVTINLFKNGGTSPIATTVTAADGSYSFTGLAPATYTVKEAVPAGWTQTFGKNGYTFSANSGSNYTGKNFADFKNVNISGSKYRDVNGNGCKDTGEPMLQGWTMDLFSSSGVLLATATTDASGNYAFTNVGPGSYVVKEENQAGWIRTSLPASYSVSPTSGTNVTGLVFGNFQLDDCFDHISCVYYVINGCTTVTDLTGNVHQGDTVKVVFTLDSTETFSLVSYTAPQNYFVADDADQQRIFDVAGATFGPGTHSLTVVVPDCNYQIDFICGTPIETFGPAGSNIFYTPQGRLFDADNGGTCTPCTFISNCGSTGSIAGTVFSDTNNNGVKNTGEVGIANVKVVLTGTTSAGQKVKMVLLTDAYGNYKFVNLKAGTYKISESSFDDYFDGKDTVGSTGGTLYNDVISNITLASGEVATGYNFADLNDCSISGRVFRDVDKDGTIDSGEVGLANVKIILTGVNDLGQNVTLTTYTDLNGVFHFDDLRAGTYKLTECTPTGYVTTKDVAGTAGGLVSGDTISNIILGWGVDAANYNFGEYK
jgi:hypothetical protein